MQVCCYYWKFKSSPSLIIFRLRDIMLLMCFIPVQKILNYYCYYLNLITGTFHHHGVWLNHLLLWSGISKLFLCRRNDLHKYSNIQQRGGVLNVTTHIAYEFYGWSVLHTALIGGGYRLWVIFHFHTMRPLNYLNHTRGGGDTTPPRLHFAPFVLGSWIWYDTFLLM